MSENAVFSFKKNAFSRWGKTILISSIIGLLCGLAAAAMRYGLNYVTESIIGKFVTLGSTQIFHLNYGVLFLPAIGGLVSGLLIHIFKVPPFQHGSNAVISAYHYKKGILSLKDGFINTLGSIATIGFGGSAGPEGPIASLGASIGSRVAGLLRLTAKERRIYLLAGCAAGVGAIFQVPLGGALFATSMLYKEPDFEHTSIMSAFVASIISYSTYMTFWGYGTHLLRNASSLSFYKAADLFPYIILGILCGLISILLAKTFRLVEDFSKSRKDIPTWALPAIGGLLVGFCALIFPQVMDGHYRFLQNSISQQFFFTPGLQEINWYYWTSILFFMILFKVFATSLTLGSGGSGGIIGPGVFIGGLLGVFLGAFFEILGHGMFSENLRLALIPVGMAGVLSATMRTPIAAIVMAIEMTGAYGLIVPYMMVAILAYIIGRRWGLNTAQVGSASDSPAHAGDVILNLLETWRVKDLMIKAANWPAKVEKQTPVHKLLTLLKPGQRPHIVVLDQDTLVGFIGNNELKSSMTQDTPPGETTAEHILRKDIFYVSPQSDVYSALDLFLQNKIEILPVVDEKSMKFLGMLQKRDIQSAVQKHFDEMREHLIQEHASIRGIDVDENMTLRLIGGLQKSNDNIEVLPVPEDILGQSLKSSSFRARYHQEVVAIQTWDGQILSPPDPDRILTSRDALLVISK